MSRGGRRYAGAGLIRRAAKAMGAGADRAPDGILGSLLVEWWDARYGYTLVGGALDSWAGQKLGVVMPAPSSGERPLWAADSTNYLSRAVMKTTGGKSLRNTSLGLSLLASGSKPYCFTLARQIATAGHTTFWQQRSNPADYTVGALRKAAPGASNFLASWDGSDAASAVNDLTVHWFECGINAGGEAQLVLDAGTPIVAGSGLDINGPVNALFFGTDQFASLSDMSMAVHLICSAEPSAGQKAAIRSWAQTVWGAP